MEKLREITQIVASNKNIHGDTAIPQTESRDEGSFNDESVTEDSNPASLMSIPSPMLSPMLASILATQDHGDNESELEQLSEATMELLRDSSEEEEDRIAVLREAEEFDSTDEETKNPVRQRRMEIEKRRQERKERRARKATKEAAVIRSDPIIGGGRASKRRRDSSITGEITAAAAAYEG